MFQHQSHRKTHQDPNNQRNTKHLFTPNQSKWRGGKYTKKKIPIPSKKFSTPTFLPPLDIRPSASNMTIATASLSKLSPKMIVNSFGSTLYVLNIAITVTGSVAERVAPSCRAVGSDKADKDSRPIL